MADIHIFDVNGLPKFAKPVAQDADSHLLTKFVTLGKNTRFARCIGDSFGWPTHSEMFARMRALGITEPFADAGFYALFHNNAGKLISRVAGYSSGLKEFYSVPKVVGTDTVSEGRTALGRILSASLGKALETPYTMEILGLSECDPESLYPEIADQLFDYPS